MNKVLFKTTRLIIEEVNLTTDITSLLAYHNDLATMQWIPNKKEQYTETDILKKFKGYDKIGNCQLGIYKIVFKSTNTTIGEIGLYSYENYNDTIEIGYIISKEYWNKGLGTELIEGVFEYLTITKTFTKVIAQLYNQNERSKALCLKMGFEIDKSDEIKSSFIKQLRQQ